MMFLDLARGFIALGILGAGVFMAMAAVGSFLKIWDGEDEPGEGRLVFHACGWAFVLIALGLLFCHWAFEVGQ